MIAAKDTAEAAQFAVAIVGGSCSGKTTVARALMHALRPNAVMIAEDDYYHCSSAVPDFDARTFNFDVPSSKDHALLKRNLEAARRGEAFDKPLYDFKTHRRRPESERILPKRFLIAEGMHLLADADLAALFDLKVFMDTDRKNRMDRRMLRDARERGREPASIAAQFDAHVEPMHAQYVEPQRALADLVLSYEPGRDIAEYVRDIAGRMPQLKDDHPREDET
ncbi:MAG TPA: uridine kinase [Caulobacterales bacterium]|nr:uridine kinase [Caulobacterales bacterium]